MTNARATALGTAIHARRRTQSATVVTYSPTQRRYRVYTGDSVQTIEKSGEVIAYFPAQRHNHDKRK